MQITIGDQEIMDALNSEVIKAKLPKNHIKQIMQRVNAGKLIKDLLELQIIASLEVVKSLK